jgi:hypothetical protein
VLNDVARGATQCEWGRTFVMAYHRCARGTDRAQP